MSSPQNILLLIIIVIIAREYSVKSNNDKDSISSIPLTESSTKQLTPTNSPKYSTIFDEDLCAYSKAKHKQHCEVCWVGLISTWALIATAGLTFAVIVAIKKYKTQVLANATSQQNLVVN